MAIDLKLIDKLLADYKKPEDMIGENGLLKQLTKALLERAMQAEMTEHLGYEKHDPAGHNSGNSRNGGTTKTLKGDFGEMPLETPRDRNGSYEPKIIGKGQTRFTGFDDKIISMYARGMSTREIQGHLEEIYKVEVSPTLISNVTEAVMEEVKSWQSRPLDAVYPIVYLDALVVKIREAGHVRNKAIYVVIGVNLQGNKEVLGLWAGQAEGAKFWLQVLTELKNRGVADVFIACVDGLKGFPEAIADGVSAGAGAAVHRAPGAGLSELRVVETAQGGGRGSAADLPGQHGRRGRTAARRVCREMGWSVSDDQPDVAPELGAPDPVLRLPGRHPQGDLHHQRGGVAEHVAAESDQDARLVSQSGRRDETAVPGLGTHRQKVDHAGAELESRLAALRDSARRPRPRNGNGVNRRHVKNSEEEHFRDGGSAPKPPRFCAFAPGFLDREASCARAPGIPAPESALGLRLRRALPSAQVRSVYQGCSHELLRPFTQKT